MKKIDKSIAVYHFETGNYNWPFFKKDASGKIYPCIDEAYLNAPEATEQEILDYQWQDEFPNMIDYILID